MRLQERIKIDDKEYTIRELTVEEIINLFSSSGQSGSSNSQDERKVISTISNIFGDSGYVHNFLKLAMPGTELKDLVKLAPSELAQLWEKVQEVNSHFFGLTKKLDLGKTMLNSAKEILSYFSKHAVSLSREAMDQEFSSSDTPSF